MGCHSPSRMSVVGGFSRAGDSIRAVAREVFESSGVEETRNVLGVDSIIYREICLFGKEFFFSIELRRGWFTKNSEFGSVIDILKRQGLRQIRLRSTNWPLKGSTGAFADLLLSPTKSFVHAGKLLKFRNPYTAAARKKRRIFPSEKGSRIQWSSAFWHPQPSSDGLCQQPLIAFPRTGPHRPFMHDV